ncbi:unnamed protein product [Calypogeia fissa]
MVCHELALGPAAWNMTWEYRYDQTDFISFGVIGDMKGPSVSLLWRGAGTGSLGAGNPPFPSIFFLRVLVGTELERS